MESAHPARDKNPDPGTKTAGEETGGSPAEGEPHHAAHKAHEDCRAFLKAARPILALGVIAAAGVCGLIYLLWPLCPWKAGYATELEHRAPRAQRVVPETSQLDVYLARDASLSPNATEYDELEKAIVEGVLKSSGDRLSYTRFGAATLPIQPASRDQRSIEENRKKRLPGGADQKTDFAVLFDKLHTAIKEEREVNGYHLDPALQHTDMIVIISDGVPDSEAHQRHCPSEFDSAGEPFISTPIHRSFEQLVNHTLPEGGKMMIFLVLAGGHSDCTPEIQSQWEHSLGSLGLKVVSSSTFRERGDIGSALFPAAGRKAGVFIKPALTRLEDDQIKRFFEKKEFAAPYLFWSRVQGGTVDLVSASLLDEHDDELAKLYVFNEHGQYPFQAESRVKVEVKDLPENGEPVPRLLYFKFDADALALPLNDGDPYHIRLSVHGNNVQTDDLPIGDSSERQWKQQLGERIKRLCYLGIVPGSIYLLLFFLFSALPRGEKNRPRLKERLHGLVIAHTKYWSLLFVMLLGILLFSAMIVVHPFSVFLAPIAATTASMVVKKLATGQSAVHFLTELLLLPCLECLAFVIAAGW